MRSSMRTWPNLSMNSIMTFLSFTQPTPFLFRFTRRKYSRQTVEEVCREYLRRVNLKRNGVGWVNERKVIIEFMDKFGQVLIEDLIPDDLEKWVSEDHAESWRSRWTMRRARSEEHTAELTSR